MMKNNDKANIAAGRLAFRWRTKRALLLLSSLLLISVGPASGQGIRIVNKTPRDGTIVKEGQSVRLSCRTNALWFFCLWKSPDGSKQCAIQENAPRNVCDTDPRMVLEGGLNNCDIVLNDVQPEDYGSWLCLVNDPEDFQSVRENIRLEVGRQAEVKFDPSFGSRNELRMTEGESIKITCAAVNGYPAARLSWEEPADAQLDVSRRPVVEHDRREHTADVQHTVEYKADLKDNSSEIHCVATQLDHDGRTVLYESSTSLKLHIEKIIVPVDNALTQKIGIISLVLLAVLLLLLLLIFCLCVCCRRRRRNRDKHSRPPSSQMTSTENSPAQPFKPIWTTDKRLVTGAGAGYEVERRQRRPPPEPSPHFSDMLEPDTPPPPALPPKKAASQATMSTRSTTSQGSWEEEDRSVGGEVEEVSVTRGKQSPSLHETHFGSDPDLPRTVHHHPDPTSTPSYHPDQMAALPPRYAQPAARQGRPSSSADSYYHPYQPGQQYGHPPPQGRPTSAMSFPAVADPGLVPGSRRLPPPNSQLTTSAKSVFDCDLGCFVEIGEDELNGDHNHHHHHHTPPQEGSHEHSSPASRTSEPREV